MADRKSKKREGRDKKRGISNLKIAVVVVAQDRKSKKMSDKERINHAFKCVSEI